MDVTNNLDALSYPHLTLTAQTLTMSTSAYSFGISLFTIELKYETTSYGVAYSATTQFTLEITVPETAPIITVPPLSQVYELGSGL